MAMQHKIQPIKIKKQLHALRSTKPTKMVTIRSAIFKFLPAAIPIYLINGDTEKMFKQ